jgi:ABC-type antimicrobial peptide transport system permease subunit
MFQLKINLRNLQRGGIYSVINIGSLAIGMAASVLLLVWVYNQWSHDRFHDKSKQIYQVWRRTEVNGPVSCRTSTSLVIGQALKDEYPEIVESVRVSETNSSYFGEGDRQIKIPVMYADPSFLTVFSFPLLHGDTKTALNDPYSIILTEKAARRLFGDEDPLGKTLMCDIEHHVIVTGIMKDLPDNTRFDFEILGSFQFVEKIVRRYGTPEWSSNWINTYVELTSTAQLEQLNASICDIIKRHTDNQVPAEVFLYPLDKSYLYNKFDNGVPAGGRITFLRLFAGLAVFILLIACINFVNLSTARAALRAKEVGVRKALGSRRTGLIRLFLSESIILAFLSGFFAFILVHATLPYFSGWLAGLSGKILSLDVVNIRFWFFALAFILFTGLLAGSYPAFHLSGFSPVKVLKGSVSAARSRIPLRKVLVVLQFSFAAFLIIGTLVVRRQIIYTQNRDAGYDREQLIYTDIGGTDLHYQALRNDLMMSGAVTNVARSLSPMTSIWGSTWDVQWRGRDAEDRRTFDVYFADANWSEMMNIEIIAGRYPDPAIWSTDSSAFLLNESAAKAIGFDDPVGEKISMWGYEGQVTGIIKDVILRSPFDKVPPMVICCKEIEGRNTLNIRLSAGKTPDKLAVIESIYRKYNPEHPFEYHFVDEEYAVKFKEVQAVESLTGFFTIIAILISCMGLFALVAFTAERRKKEIGIRKVLGASTSDIVLLLSKEYIVLTLVAFVIATPAALFVVNQYLNMFDYRTSIPVWLIMAVGALIFIIAMLTVGFQAIKAATANPVKAIKSE